MQQAKIAIGYADSGVGACLGSLSIWTLLWKSRRELTVRINLLPARPQTNHWPSQPLALAPVRATVGGRCYAHVDLTGRGGTTARVCPVIIGDGQVSAAAPRAASNGNTRGDMFDIAAYGVEGDALQRRPGDA